MLYPFAVCMRHHHSYYSQRPMYQFPRLLDADPTKTVKHFSYFKVMKRAIQRFGHNSSMSKELAKNDFFQKNKKI